MILYPSVFLLLLGGVCRGIHVGGEVFVVFVVKERPWRSGRYRQFEGGTAAWEHLVVGGGARQCQPKVKVITVSVANKEVVPVLQYIASV